MFDSQCSDLILDGEKCLGVRLENGEEIYASDTVVATGRRGADWLEKLCADHGIAHQPGTVDIGVRVEVRNEIIETINDVLYESKLVGYPKPFKNKVRTFCQNPGGFVAQETTTMTLQLLTVIHIKSLKAKTQTLLFSALITFPFLLISR